MILNPGTPLLEGRYIVSSKLGCGGLGCAYIAKNHSGTDVVAKVPNLASEAPPNITVDKLNVEISVLKHIWDSSGHKYIVRYLEDGNIGIQPILMEEFVIGNRLDKLIKSKVRLSVRDSIQLCIKLLEAVKFMHSRSIIHRDLCPDNVIIRNAMPPDPVIIDFGSCKMGYVQMGDKGYTRIGGKPCIAPEVRLGGISYTSDLYSVIATLFCMLMGTIEIDKYLVPTPSGLEFSDKPSSIAGYGGWLGDVLDACLDPDPTKRKFQNAEQLIYTLNGHPIPTTRAQASLIILGQVYSLDLSRPFSIGRDTRCDAVVNDPGNYLSRQHATIYYDKSHGSWIVRDVNSFNGTAVIRGTNIHVVFTGTAHGSRGNGFFELRDGDVIGLAFNPERGILLELEFRMG